MKREAKAYLLDNVLVHGYAIIDDATVWSAVRDNLPALLEEVENLYRA